MNVIRCSVPVLLWFALGCLSPCAARSAEAPQFINPYEGVDWESVGYFHANLHTHTTYSDGRYDPHQAIDKYHDLGYHILALTDHDTDHYQVRPKALYPWTRLNNIFHEIKDETHGRYGASFGQRANEEWQDRDPEALDMLSVQGSEISGTHHLGSYFSDYASGKRDEETVFQDIAERDGISVFFHPGRYNRDADWYVDFFERHPHLVGFEIYNQADRYPVDRQKWDRILHRTMPDRPVWGFANDDTHTRNHFGRNRNIFLIPEMRHDYFRDAMVNGHFYLYVPEKRGDLPAVKLTSITATGDHIRLEIEGDVNEIQWITHDPEANDSHIVQYGPDISSADLPAYARFVRAQILSDDGRTYTQPFGIRR